MIIHVLITVRLPLVPMVILLIPTNAALPVIVVRLAVARILLPLIV